MSNLIDSEKAFENIKCDFMTHTLWHALKCMAAMLAQHGSLSPVASVTHMVISLCLNTSTYKAALFCLRKAADDGLSPWHMADLGSSSFPELDQLTSGCCNHFKDWSRRWVTFSLCALPFFFACKIYLLNNILKIL